MQLSEKITRLKKKKGLSQSDLAELTGISRDAISKYERGDSIPSVLYAKKIAAALGVSLDYLASDDDKEEELDKEAVSRIKNIQALPTQEKEKIFSVIDALVRDYKAKETYS